MKKLLTLALAAVMVLALLAGCSSASPSDEGSSPGNASPADPGNSPAVNDPSPNDPDPIEEGDWLYFEQPGVATTAGRPTSPSGRFTIGENTMNGDFLAGWTNLTGNARAKELLAGYSTIALTTDSQFVPNPMVLKGLLIETNDDQSKTYTMKIHENLKFSDGTPITAKHFVFDALWGASPFMAELEADTFVGSEPVRGSLAYHNGETNVLEGVRLLGDYEFSITIDYETTYYEYDEDGEIDWEWTETEINFPFWFQLTYADAGAAPLHVIAPGCDVVDNGSGVEMTGPWSVDLLRSTVDDGSNGERYNRTVNTGPYKFVSYDASDNIAVLEVNEHYQGDYAGFKPMIQTIVIKVVASTVLVEEFVTGGVDIVVQTSGGEQINALLDVADEGTADYINYARNGYGKITFRCSEGPTQFAEVRRAVAYCLDRDEVVRQWTGGYGEIVHSRLGAAQWMYIDNRDLVDSALTAYVVNVDKAREGLIEGGWIYDADGNDYESGTRHKKLDDGTLMPLHVEWFSPDSNILGAMYENLLKPNLDQIGFSFNRDEGDSAAFSAALYGRSEKYYGMVNGGVGFATMDSPWYYYDPNLFGPYNGNYIDEPALYDITMQMKATEPGDTESYFSKWFTFVKLFNELLPDLPCYSDVYFDFFTPSLKGYDHTAIYPYTYALIRAWID